MQFLQPVGSAVATADFLIHYAFTNLATFYFLQQATKVKVKNT